MSPTAFAAAAQDIARHLDEVRLAAMSFHTDLEAAQPKYDLVRFGVDTFFEKASSEAYNSLRHAFLQARTVGGTTPTIDDSEIRAELIGALEAGTPLEVAQRDVMSVVARAAQRLDELLPASQAEAEVNRQLADRAWDELRLGRQEFVLKAGRVVLTNYATIDSLDKKYSKRNNYAYSTTEAIGRQARVLRELAIAFNADRDAALPTRFPTWDELHTVSKAISRTPNVLPLFGGELKCRVSCFEWHLDQDFASFISEFISLHR